MNGATTIQERLKDLRLNKGLKLEELAEQTGISKSALGSYEKDDYKEINHGNLILLADFYGVSLDYLFCRTENRAEINTPLSELHLSDEMVALLKSGRINNRLLCELATHKDFIKFLADIEIYVDGIATMQIQNLNALVDTVRHEIIERYRPGEDDPHLKVLQAAHISDDEYFSHMVLDDLNLIILDIREAHKKDSESAPQITVADELKENLEAVENFKGSRDEKLVVLFQNTAVNPCVGNILNASHLLWGQIGCNDERQIGFVSLVNHRVYLFQGKLRISFHAEIIDDQQIHLAKRGNILAAFFDLQIAQLVQNPGKVGHHDRNTLIEKPIGNAGGKERLSCAHISPKQKAKVFCLDLLPVIHITLSHLDIGGILCYPKVPVQQMRVLNALLPEFCNLHQVLQAAVFLL